MTDTNLTIKQGSEWHIYAILKNDSGTVVNLTDYTAKMQIRKSKDKTSQLYDDLSTSNGRLVITALEGKIDIYIPSTASDKYKFTLGYYDLEIVSLANDVTRILEGEITINKNVTD